MDPCALQMLELVSELVYRPSSVDAVATIIVVQDGILHLFPMTYSYNPDESRGVAV